MMTHGRRLKCESLEGRCLLAAHLLSDAPIEPIASIVRRGYESTSLASSPAEYSTGGQTSPTESVWAVFQGPLVSALRVDRSATESSLSSIQDPYRDSLSSSASQRLPDLDWDGDEIVILTGHVVSNGSSLARDVSLILVNQPVPPLSMATTDSSFSRSTLNLGTLARGNSLVSSDRNVESTLVVKLGVSTDCCHASSVTAKPNPVSPPRVESPVINTGSSYLSQDTHVVNESPRTTGMTSSSPVRHVTTYPVINVSHDVALLDAYGQSLRSGSEASRTTATETERDAYSNGDSSNPRFGGFVELNRAEFRSAPLARRGTSASQDPWHKLDEDETDPWVENLDSHGRGDTVDGEGLTVSDWDTGSDAKPEVDPENSPEWNALESPANPADLAIEQLFASHDQQPADADTSASHPQNYGGMIWLANNSPSHPNLGQPVPAVRDANVDRVAGGVERDLTLSSQPIVGHAQAFELNRGESPTDSMLVPPTTERTTTDVASEKGTAAPPAEQETPRAATLGIPAVGLAVMLLQEKRRSVPERSSQRPSPRWCRFMGRHS